tara:strand:+ start:112 stop:684 length:573 start_codon:yes stop_codon:yes gene_type:complete
MRKFGLLTIITFSLFISGCAYVPHTLNLSINAPNPPSNIGDGLSIYINVIDDRDSEIIGKRGVSNIGGSITADQLMPIFETAIINGFKNKSFTITQNQDADISLQVKLRAFKYMVSQGFWTGGEDISVVINAEAKNSGSNFQKTYRFSNEERIVFIAEGSGLDKNLNAALNKTISELLNDRELDNFLSKN